jgi:hypothetical protein
MYRAANPMKFGTKSLTSTNSRAYSRATAGTPAKGRRDYEDLLCKTDRSPEEVVPDRR